MSELAGGADLEKVKFSKSKVNDVRAKAVTEDGQNIVHSTVTRLKGHKLQLHTDTKEVSQQDHDVIIRKIERLAVNVTSPELPGEDFLLGVIPVKSAKGIDIANGIYNLLEKYDLLEETVSVCTDTTASMSGIRNGFIVQLQNKISRSLLWTLCRRHSSERHVKKALWQLSEEGTFGPTHPLYQQLRRKWPTADVNSKLNQLTTFNWDSKPELIKSRAREAVVILKRFKADNVFPRADYKELVNLSLLYLTGEVDGVNNSSISSSK